MGSKYFLALLRKRPFQPFRVYVSDGASYDVTHPEAAQVFGAVLLALLPVSTILGPAVERRLMVSFIHITRVEIFLFGDAQAS
jgi:hypothetical protein